MSYCIQLNIKPTCLRSSHGEHLVRDWSKLTKEAEGKIKFFILFYGCPALKVAFICALKGGSWRVKFF